jgi:hypothetical protein
MEEELKRFVYHKNGWPIPQTPVKVKKNPNIRGEQIGTLYLDGKPIQKGSFALLQKKKKEYCINYGISKERAKKRFKMSY